MADDSYPTSWQPGLNHDVVFAIVRVDDYDDVSVPLEQRIVVKEVVWTAEKAQREVERLNELGKGKYFWVPTRLMLKRESDT